MSERAWRERCTEVEMKANNEEMLERESERNTKRQIDRSRMKKV